MSFSLSESVSYKFIFFFATTTFSRFGLPLSMTVVFEFGLFYVHWGYGVCLLTEAIDYSHTTGGWKFQFPLSVSNSINMDYTSVYPYSLDNELEY